MFNYLQSLTLFTGMITCIVSIYSLNFILWYFKSPGTASLRWRYWLIRFHQIIIDIVHVFIFCKCCRSKPPPWSNPKVIATGNILKSHVPLRSYDSPKECLIDSNGSFPFLPTIAPEKRKFVKSKWEMSLDGVWKFKLYPRPDAINGGLPPNIPTMDENDDNIVTINVPGCWEMQGFDVPIYTNIQYPWLDGPNRMCCGNLLSGYHSGNVPYDNPTGLYKRTLTLPKEWNRTANERNLILHLGSVASATRVIVNNIDVGFFKDSFTETEIDITSAIQSIGYNKEHCIVLQVMRFSDGSWLEDQDHW
jgi:hypothetical protein